MFARLQTARASDQIRWWAREDIREAAAVSSRRGSRKRQLQQVTKRIKGMMWTAIVIAVVYAMALATSTVWGSLAPQWLQVMLEQRDRFLTLGAAIFGLLAIVEPSHAMPKAYLATVIAGGLTVYAAVLNSFNPTTLGVAGGILLATFPVFLLLTTTWRMPRRWEWAGWPAIASIVTLVAVVSTINTPLAVLIVAIL